MQKPLEEFDQLIAQTKTDIVNKVHEKVNDKEFALQLPALVDRRVQVVIDCSKCD